MERIEWNPFKGTKNILWLIISLMLPIIVIAISTLILSLLGNKFIAWEDTTYGYVITIIATLLGCIFEEIGWRGFLLPQFRRKYSLFYSAVGVGVLWGVWHCKFAYGILGFVLFVILIVEFSILMTWIYIKTNRNIVCMMLFHLGVNCGSVLLLQNREGVLFYAVTDIIYAILCTTIVLKNKKIFFNINRYKMESQILIL